MQKRIKLATALVHDPELIFLHEQTHGLDPAGRTEMLAIVAELAREHGKNVVLSSHLLRDVERVCAHVVMLENGRVMKVGVIDELTSDHTGTYEVALQGGADGYAEALSGAGAVVAGDGPLVVQLPPGATTRLLFEVARDCGVLVRGLKPTRRSLEDVFMAELEGAGDR